jgi:hypothetical protein
VTWLALLAMALIVVMPVLSRTLSMASMPGMDSDCPIHHAAGAKHPSSPQTPADPTERCGYCALLNHTPPLACAVATWLSPGSLPGAVASVQPRQQTPPARRLSADPRGPPAAG